MQKIEVIAAESGLILRGRVSTYQMKQVAQAVTLKVPGVREIQNELEVT